jgi:hypothetical protein
MIEQPAQNKMMTSAPSEKAGFHFSGDGIWRPAYIWAEHIEAATKEWLKTRKSITPMPEQSTAPVDTENKE